MATTQTALALTTIAAPLTKIELPIPTPKGNEVLLRVTAAAIAPFDQKLRDYGLFNIGSRLPAVLALDLVGVVEGYSSTISNELKTKFPTGTHIFVQANLFNPLGGGLQQYTTVDPTFAAAVPKSVSDVAAASFPINAFTSFASLFSDEGGEHRGLGIPFPGTPGAEEFDYKGTTVMILGGGTRCGKLAIQFAKIAGIGRVLTTAGKGSKGELERLGASVVFDRGLEEGKLVEEVRKVTGGELAYVYDTMSTGKDQELGVKLLGGKKKGFFVTLLEGEVDEGVLKEKDVEKWQMTGVSGMHPSAAAVMWGNIGEWVGSGLEGGGFKVVEGLDLEKANATMDAYRDGGFERVHVKVSE